jgi:hypothetical protein
VMILISMTNLPPFLGLSQGLRNFSFLKWSADGWGHFKKLKCHRFLSSTPAVARQ